MAWSPFFRKGLWSYAEKRRERRRTHADPWPPIGVNLVKDAGFVGTPPLVWEEGVGWTVGGGAATAVAGTLSDLMQLIDMPTGSYRCELDLAVRTAGQVRVLIMDAASVTTFQGALRGAVGVYTEDFSLTESTVFNIRKTATFAGAVRSVSLLYLGP